MHTFYKKKSPMQIHRFKNVKRKAENILMMYIIYKKYGSAYFLLIIIAKY